MSKVLFKTIYQDQSMYDGLVAKVQEINRIYTSTGSCRVTQKEVRTDREILFNKIKEARGSTVDDAVGYVKQSFNDTFDDLDYSKVRWIIEEFVKNALLHGRDRRGNRFYNLDVYTIDGSLLIHVRGGGKGFDITKVPDPTTDKHLEDLARPQTRADKLASRDPGGYGLLIAATYAERIVYNSKGTEVVIEMRGSNPPKTKGSR